MPTLTIAHARHRLEPQVPHIVAIDGMALGMMRGDRLNVALPRGRHTVRVQFGGEVPVGKRGRKVDLSVSSTAEVYVGHDTTIYFSDREKLWNILFDIDLVVWVVSLFVTLGTVYKVISDAFFAAWLVRLLLIRKRYYKIRVDGNTLHHS